MAAAAVHKWASNSTKLERTVDDVLLGSGTAVTRFLTPSQRTTTRRWGADMWSVGFDCLRGTLWQPPSSDECRRMQRCAAAVPRQPERAAREDDTLVVNMRALLQGPLARRT